MNLNNLHKIYFLGIGGIGMSALARYFNQLGIEIHGYDRVSTPLTQQLEAEGMNIHYEDDKSKIPSEIDLVIHTPAVPNELTELAYFRKNQYSVLKRSEVLGLLTSNKFTIAIAGTHGKTSITSLIAHIFKTAERNVRAFVGGVCKNYDSNYIAHGQPETMIVEADEYDRSFLRLSPDIAIITSMDADHLDIYTNQDNLKMTFTDFSNRLKQGGQLIHHKKLEISVRQDIRKFSYGIAQGASKAGNIRIAGGVFHFDLELEGNYITNISFGVPGRHNIENAIAAADAASKAGIPLVKIREALITYQGVQRRFDFRIRTEKMVYIDDYAHHPCELEACISAVRELFPTKKIT